MQKDNKTLLEELGIDLHRINNDGKTICPKCSHLRKKKNDPCLSVNVIEGKYNCWNDTCDFHGIVGGTYQEKIEKTYVRPKFINTTQVGTKILDWFFLRGITPITLNKARITESKSYDGSPLINFNYFRDGELINVKYRKIPKEFRLEKSAELIFYGLDNIKDSDWCVIVEGEIDALSFMEAGVNEVVSVPNGASKSSVANLEYLDNCIDYFKNKKKVILATDNDEAGRSLRDELARRIGYDVCFKIDFKGYKDANEFLMGESIDKLKSLILEPNLIDFPIDGIITAEMIWDKVEEFQLKGLERGDLTHFIPELDDFLSFVPGQLMVLTGIPNHGKSPFALAIMTALSIKNKWKWGLFTPEHKPLEIFLVKMCELLLGRKFAKGVVQSSTQSMMTKNFINEHFFFIEPEDESYTLENILAKAKELVKRKGISGLLIDPWNKLEHNLGKGDNETTYISKELDKIIKFNQKNKVLSIVVAHPVKIRKQFKSELFEVPSLYDISGSSNWFNKPDIGVTFYRNFLTGTSEVYIQKMKYDHLGKQGLCMLRYNMNNGRFNGKNAPFDNSNWLLGKPHQTEMHETITTEIARDDDDIPF